MDQARRPGLTGFASLAGYGYLFFLAIELLGRGMKMSFAAPLKAYLEGDGAGLGELGSFMVGVLGTALVQSSSTVTSMAVVLTQEGVIPLVVAVGVVHGANLGTSVTSSVVAFFTNVRPSTGSLWRDLKAMVFEPRSRGFRAGVGTAVVHDMFNVVMVTGILIALELPFGIVRGAAGASADAIGHALHATSWLPDAMKVVSPGTYTKPVSKALLSFGVPAWALALAGLPLLFAALKGFARRMKAVALRGVDEKDLVGVGERLLGRTDTGTFLRGLILTTLIQSSSATTSLVVPLAAMGLFSVRKVFPFILGANIGTCATAVLAASAGVGSEGFHVGMTVALSHLYLNTLAVALVVVVPGLRPAILAAAEWLGSRAAQRPVLLLGYLGLLAIVAPAVVATLPEPVALAFLGGMLTLVVVGPGLSEANRRRRRRKRQGSAS